jgi:hypothetical protein
MAFNLRLPDALEADARARCERLGISLNALICVALDGYLRGVQSAAEPLQPARDVGAVQRPAEPAPAAAEPVQPAQPRSAQTVPERSGPWSKPDDDPKPVLGAKPTPKDRKRLAEWYRRHPANG